MFPAPLTTIGSGTRVAAGGNKEVASGTEKDAEAEAEAPAAAAGPTGASTELSS